MSERPILLNTAMVRAVLAGRKTQTRRPYRGETDPPLGWPGDLLWVRETWMPGDSPGDYWYRADADPPELRGHWRPSIHMPRELSRLTLRMEYVRRELLPAITWQDVLKEGVGDAFDRRRIGQFQEASPEVQAELFATFRTLWNGCYGKNPEFRWEAYPSVWVYTFSILEVKNDR